MMRSYNGVQARLNNEAPPEGNQLVSAITIRTRWSFPINTGFHFFSKKVGSLNPKGGCAP